MEMEPLSRGTARSQFDSDQYSYRRYPLNPNGHFTTNLLIGGFRRRLRIKQMPVQTYQEWDSEPLLTNHGPGGVHEYKGGAMTSDRNQSGDSVEVNINA
jgi:hypothetical protein